MRRAIVLLLGLSLGACGELSSTDSDILDPSLACDHFRNVAYDVGEGLLTYGEMREKLREVYDNSFGTYNDVHSAARQMLSAATRQDEDRLVRAINKMDRACAAHGV